MASAMELWLKNRLGICLKLDSPELGEHLYDGIVFYKLFISYNIINPESVQAPKKNPSLNEALTFLFKLCPWLKLIGVTHSKEFLTDVASKHRNHALRLLFEMFLRLEDKDNIYLITKQRESHLLSKEEQRFQVSPAEKIKVLPKVSYLDYKLEMPAIQDQVELVNKYKAYKQQIKKECKEESRLRRTKIDEANRAIKAQGMVQPVYTTFKEEKKWGGPIEHFVQDFSGRSKSTDEFINCSPRDQINYLKQKRRKTLANEVLKLKMQNMLLHELWASLLSKQEEEFERTFKDKLLQQSQFEKKLAIRLATAHENFKAFFEQKRKVTKQVPEDNFEYIVKDEVLRRKTEDISLEKNRILELHERLYKEKLRVKRLKDEEMCRAIAYDLVDLAVLISEHEKEYKIPVSRTIMNDWKELFYKGIPVFPYIFPHDFDYVEGEEFGEFILSEHSTENIPEYINTYDAQIFSDRYVTETLNNFRVHSYLYLVGSWFVDELWPELANVKEKLNIIGFDVHRLLEFKYPFPPPPPPANLHFKYRAILGDLTDQTFINNLQVLLAKPKVAIIHIAQALNYCLEMYNLEKSITEFGRTIKDLEKGDKKKGTRKSMARGSRRSVAKGSKKSLTRSSSKTSSSMAAGSKKRGSHTGAHGHLRKGGTEHKAVQFPSVDDILRQIKHSPAALLGKIAFETLNRGEQLNDVLMAKMLIEYLKTLKDYNGFVLTDYPISVSQAALLEFLMTGKQSYNPYPISSQVDLFMTKLMNPPLTVDHRLLMEFDENFIDFINETHLEVIPHPPIRPATTQVDETEDVMQEYQLEEEMTQEEETGEVEEEEIVVEKLKKGKTSGGGKGSLTKKKKNKKPVEEKKAKVPEQSPVSGEAAEVQVQTPVKPDLLIPEPFFPEDGPIQPISYTELIKLRTSKILPRPNELDPVIPNMSSYFQKYLTNKENRFDKKLEKDKKDDTHSPDKDIKEKQDQLPTSEPPLIADGIENPTPFNFYMNLGIVKPIEGDQHVDVSGTKKIARMIIDETDDLNDPYRKDSIELFGAVALETVAKTSKSASRRASQKKSRRASQKRGSTRKGSQKRGSTRRASQKRGSTRRTSKKRGSTRRASNRRASQKGKHSQSPDDSGTKSFKKKGKPTDTIDEAKTEVEEEQLPVSTADLEPEKTEIKIDQEIVHVARPKPGQDGWVYAKEPILPELQIALASIWEVVEHTYLSNLYQVMHLLRIHEAKLLPYRNYVRILIDECLDVPDDRLNIVTNFQLMFNDVDDIFRKDPQMKAELFCRVYELYNLLCEIADQKKQLSEEKRLENINQNWITNYISPLINLYVCILQLELDRFVDTIQILDDYYIAMLGSKPDVARMKKTILHRAAILDDKEINENENHKKVESSNKSVTNFVKDIRDFLTNEKTSESREKMESQKVILAEEMLHPSLHSAYTKIKHIQAAAKLLIANNNIGKELKKSYNKNNQNKEESSQTQIKKQAKRRRNSKRQHNRKASPKKQGSASGTKSARTDSPLRSVSWQSENDTIDIVDKIKLEWECAVDNEVERILFRMKLIEAKAKDNVAEVFDITGTVFNDFEVDIVQRYHREIYAIENLCKVLRAAIEDETAIQPLLILDGDRFYIDKSNILFPDVPPPPPTPLEEISSEYAFTIRQLDNFVTKMTHVAPAGVMEGVFIDILDDMITFTTEYDHPYLPVGWAKLNKVDLRYLLKQAFGDAGVFDWRDFVIYAANLPPPTIEQLMDLKNKFREIDTDELETITYEQFMNTQLWFDKDFGDTIEDDLRLALAKQLVFKMFQVNKDEINYSAMLLSFCKGEDSLEGFMKALTLLDDRGILADAECYKDTVIKNAEAQKIADQIIVQLLHDVLQATEGITVKTLPRHYNEEIFGIGEDEYTLSEQILMWGSGREEYGEVSHVSSDLDNVTIGYHPIFEDDYTYPDRFNHPKWHICIPYDLVLSILIIAMNFYAVSPDHLHQQLELENRLKTLFNEKGQNGYIKAYILAESDVLKDITENTGIFKYCNLSYFVEKILEARN